MLSELFQNNVDIAGLVETNINWNPISFRQANILLRKQFGYGTMINATSDEPSSSVYKQGGTSLLLTGNIISTIDKEIEIYTLNINIFFNFQILHEFCMAKLCH